ncbi:MAG: DUF1684 domain-containing protein [Candidatus Latescibacterota bacterium]|nr:DUF1684 domain-containing protein [Candidatus Latescibacterota bacterium]
MLIAFGVGVSQAATPFDELISEHAEARAHKDSMFRHDPKNSPLNEDGRAHFEGLVYFDVDVRYRFEGEFHRFGRLRQVRVADSSGATMLVERYGRFVFQWEGNTHWLEVYRSLQGGGMTVYFTDPTNSNQTYEVGRYAPVTVLDDGTHVLDFNGAYNPYCAYNLEYVCPLPPPQNRLPFSVLAGERSDGPDLAH